MRELIDSLGCGARWTCRQPAVAALIVVTMAVGIGLLTAAFSLVDAVLLERLPYDAAHRLVALRVSHPEMGPSSLIDEATFGVIARETRSFASIGGTVPVSLQVETHGGARQVDAALVTPALLEMLPVHPDRGRAFSAGDGRAGGPLVALLSHRLWKDAFQGDPGIIGRPVRFVGADLLGTADLGGERLTVAGVLPEGFKAPFAHLDPQVWIARDLGASAAGATHLLAYGRLRPGVDLPAAQAEAAAVYARVQREQDPGSRWQLAVMPLREFLAGDILRPLELLLLAGLLVLFVAAANTANIVAAQARLRRSEAAVRVMLGAGRRHLFHQFLTEGVLVSILAGALGLALAWAALRLFRGLGMVGIPRRFDIGIDASVVVFVVLLALGTNVLLALVPVLRLSRLKPADVLGGGDCGVAAPSARLGITARYLFISLQICTALAVTVSSLLLVRSFHALLEVDPGFEARGVATGWVAVPESEYPEPADKAALYRRLLERLHEIPDVEEAALVNYLPFGKGSGAMEFAAEGPALGTGTSQVIEFRAVSPGYLKTMRIPLVEGRYLDERDLAAQKFVVSEKAARLLWGEGSPIGQRLKMGGLQSRNPWLTVVGVVADVRHDSLTEEGQPTVYMPFLYFPQMAVAARSRSGRPEVLGAALDGAVRQSAGRMPLFDVQTLEERISSRLGKLRLISWLMGLFAVVTLLLAVVGIYGVLWRTAVERSREFQVRAALGATRWSLVSLMLRRVGPWATGGLAAGLLCSVALSGTMVYLLFGIEPIDPATFGVSTTLVGVVSLIGVCLPAWQAAGPAVRLGLRRRKSPVPALRSLRNAYRALLSGILPRP